MAKQNLAPRASPKIKWSRLRRLLDAVKQQPLTIHEACKILSNEVSMRMVENYFAELKALGLVIYDDETKIYEPANSKRIFQSKYDYDLALEHSKNLVFSSIEKQRFDQMNPFLALDKLVFYDLCLGHFKDDIDDRCVIQHLKTGYFKSVYRLIEKYRQLMDETGLSKSPSLPKLYVSEFDLDGTPEELVGKASTLTDKYVNVEEVAEGLFGTGEELVRKYNLPPRIYKQKLKEILNLRNLLVGKIYSIVNDVRNGIPLRGYCNHCPSQKLTIKE